MKPRITHLLCILVLFGLCSLQGYARNGVPELEVQALIKEADSCRACNNLYRALSIYEEAYLHEASTEILRKIIQCHYERGGYQKCIDLYESVPSDSMIAQDLKNEVLLFLELDAGRQCCILWQAGQPR